MGYSVWQTARASVSRKQDGAPCTCLEFLVLNLTQQKWRHICRHRNSLSYSSYSVLGVERTCMLRELQQLIRFCICLTSHPIFTCIHSRLIDFSMSFMSLFAKRHVSAWPGPTMQTPGTESTYSNIQTDFSCSTDASGTKGIGAYRADCTPRGCLAASVIPTSS